MIRKYCAAFASTLILMVQVSISSISPVHASETLTVQMGKTLTFSASQALSPSHLSTYSTSCNAIGFSIKVTSTATSEFLYEKNETFETEHCLNKPSHWLDVFRWENTVCTLVSTPCVSMPTDDWIAPPGDYEITFDLAMGGQSPTLLSNSIPIVVIGSFFYVFTDQAGEVFPYKDGAMDNVEGSMEFWNETGTLLENYPRAKLGLRQGKKSIATTTSGVDGSYIFKISKPIKGNFEVFVISIPNPAGGKQWVPAGANTKFTTLETKVSSVTLSSTPEVFPSKDGYKDTASIAVSSQLTTGQRGKITGSIKILLGTKLVKIIPISLSGAKNLKWDGKVNGRIVPGTYNIVANVRGPEGGTIRKATKIKVSPKRLVSTTISKTYGAYSVADESQGDSYDPISRNGSYGARFYSSGYGDTMLVKLSIPVNAKTEKWRIRFNNWETFGATFVYLPCRNAQCASSFVGGNNLVFSTYDEGTSWSRWASLRGNTANFSIGSLDWGSLYVESFTIEYVTTLLK